MDFLTKIKWTPLNILKAVAIGLGALIILLFVISLVGTTFRSVMPTLKIAGMPAMSDGDYSVSPGMGGGYYAEEMAYDSMSSEGYGGMATLSARNAASSMPYPLPPMSPQGTTGETAEEFEVTEYSASIETREKEVACGTIADLKSRTDVIFENSNDYEEGCNFTFKVRHASVAEILTLIKKLDPKDVQENTYTIKNQVDDFTSETEILQKKLVSIEETLSGALTAYDEITRLATQSQDAGALARIIDSKIQLIERLSHERISINEQLDRYARMKTEQLDRLEYTYFHVNVFEYAFVDGEQLKDSWKESIRQFFLDLNKIAQDLSVNLILLFFMAVQWILYVLILVVIAKYVWKAVRYIWER